MGVRSLKQNNTSNNVEKELGITPGIQAVEKPLLVLLFFWLIVCVSLVGDGAWCCFACFRVFFFLHGAIAYSVSYSIPLWRVRSTTSAHLLKARRTVLERARQARSVEMGDHPEKVNS